MEHSSAEKTSFPHSIRYEKWLPGEKLVVYVTIDGQDFTLTISKGVIESITTQNGDEAIPDISQQHRDIILRLAGQHEAKLREMHAASAADIIKERGDDYGAGDGTND